MGVAFMACRAAGQAHGLSVAGSGRLRQAGPRRGLIDVKHEGHSQGRVSCGARMEAQHGRCVGTPFAVCSCHRAVAELTSCCRRGHAFHTHRIA